MEIVNLVRSLGVSHKHSTHNDDLFVDRLNHKYTVTIIVIFTIVVTASQYYFRVLLKAFKNYYIFIFNIIGQYAGNPINCW